MHKSGFLHRFISEWLSAYLFYCGLLLHFTVVLLVVAAALKPSPRRELERVGYAVLEPIATSAGCTGIFHGQVFDWQNPRGFNLPLNRAENYRVLTMYRNLGLKGQTSAGNDVFQISIDLDIQNAKGYRTAVQPVAQTYFEVNKDDVIERCHVKVNEDRAFDCLLEKGEAQMNGDCLLPVAGQNECDSFAGELVDKKTCRLPAGKDIPKHTATKALSQLVSSSQPCEKPGWFRTIACAEGGRRCRPVSLCQYRGDTP